MKNYKREIGAERVTPIGYVEVKTADGAWKMKQRVEWEKVNGPLNGKTLQCLNGNKTDCRPQNWQIKPEEAIRKGIVYIKTGGKWRMKAEVEYERHHGKIPNMGYLIIHLNEDKRDFSPDNLRIVHRAQWALVQLTLRNGVFKKRVCVAFQHPIGTERLTKHDFVQVKVAHDTWRFKHYIEYERNHGPIPKGMRIGFRDRNPLNYTKENLYAATAREILERNAGHHLPPEIKACIEQLRQLTKLINKKERDGGQE